MIHSYTFSICFDSIAIIPWFGGIFLVSISLNKIPVECSCLSGGQIDL